MKILLPPSEGKKVGGILGKSTVKSDLPFSIAENATEKDLKCSGKRYEEGILFNKNIASSGIMPAIERYTGVMFSGINYFSLDERGKDFFNGTVRIISGMYGLISSTDTIANYKLPVDTKGLRDFWGDELTNTLEGEDVIIDLLPLAHKKYINFSLLEDLGTKIVHCDFYHGEKKLTHGVKGAKGFWLHSVAELSITDYKKWPKEFLYKGKKITVQYT